MEQVAGQFPRLVEDFLEDKPFRAESPKGEAFRLSSAVAGKYLLSSNRSCHALQYGFGFGSNEII